MNRFASAVSLTGVSAPRCLTLSASALRKWRRGELTKWESTGSQGWPLTSRPSKLHLTRVRLQSVPLSVWYALHDAFRSTRWRWCFWCRGVTVNHSEGIYFQSTSKEGPDFLPPLWLPEITSLLESQRAAALLFTFLKLECVHSQCVCLACRYQRHPGDAERHGHQRHRRDIEVVLQGAAGASADWPAVPRLHGGHRSVSLL